MNILGLHFGHDAAVCILRDGKVAAYVMRERHARIKHAISLEWKNIQTAMDEAQLRWEQIDYCAITSTQNIELIIDDPANFSVSMERHQGHQAPCTLADLVKTQNFDPSGLLVNSLVEILYNPSNANTYLYHHYGPSFPQYQTLQQQEIVRFGTIDIYVNSSLWQGGGLGKIAVTDFSDALRDDSIRHGFHYPVTVRLAGHSVPGYYIAHHMAHAASSFYQSGMEEAAILTHDGFANGLGYLSGMFFCGKEHRIYPITPHHLAIGALYEQTGVQLGMGATGPSGKLMGLAGYGLPKFFDRRFVGNQYDWIQEHLEPNAWLNHCVKRAREMDYDLEPLGDPSRARAPINTDIAASTQKLFEETNLQAVDALAKVASRVGMKTDNLCISGGTALNCPSNSRIFRESCFRQIFVEPGCDDSGLAIGAATFLYHNVLDFPLSSERANSAALPYCGVEITDNTIRNALEDAGNEIQFTVCQDSAQTAAEDIAAGRIIGWFEGRSEIGPRALGHRSILADPRQSDNWERVNTIKGREMWRPFAPSVLESEAEKWFLGLPSCSPYMLFTGMVRSHDLPAITHNDGSARVQTVNPSCGEFFRVIEHFFAKTGVPVILNTSFNGPSQPIVETPADALHFLTHSKLDAVYMCGMRVVRRGSEC